MQSHAYRLSSLAPHSSLNPMNLKHMHEQSFHDSYGHEWILYLTFPQGFLQVYLLYILNILDNPVLLEI